MKGLFHERIIASGPGFAHTLIEYGHLANPFTLAVGGAVGPQVSEVLSAYSLDEIRALPTEQIMAIQLLRAARQRSLNLLAAGAKIKLDIFDSGYRVIDGQIWTLAPWDALTLEP